MTPIAPTLQAFFTDRLIKQLDAGPRTIASYRDTLRLLLCFANDRTGIAPAALDWDHLDESLIAAFSKPTGTTAQEPGTSGSPPSAPCSDMPRCATPNTQP